MTAESGACPVCAAPVEPTARFCEACGAPLSPTQTQVATPAPDLPIELTVSLQQPSSTPMAQPPRRCQACGGTVAPDGYCETCGAKAPRERDHYVERPASWVAACCDRGVQHHRNEDAAAVAASAEPGERAVLVVCDGVSTSDDSDVASLAAARAAREVLVASRPVGLGVPESRAAAIERSLVAAAAAANDAVIASTSAATANPASCTYVAAVIEDDLCVVGNVGDSRAYWIPDPGSGDPLQLTSDDSVAQLRIDSGVPRAEAEAGPQAHAILKWLGLDSADARPTTGWFRLAGSGWVLVCSDGLWNYASEATGLRTLVGELGATAGGDPLALAEGLVRWACDQGGKDNVTVALARRG